jgi:serine/threonine-protein kinase
MSDPAHWARIEAILDELIELSPEARRSRLDDLPASERELRGEVQRLLDEDSRGGDGILDLGLAALAGRVLEVDDEPTAEAGQRIGPYRIVRELGRGGMGEVLLAERVDGDFEQLVALKIIRGGPNRAEVVERFRHERRILATLRHANIAALYDGGATEDGAPYFAMEFVEGERIHEYCDERRLSLAERIDLFDAVCRAVQYAHQNLVIHRDLKPSNVLVTAEGTVKLLDFGIAKVVDSDSDDAEQTQAASRFLTPAYAAPEQILDEPTSTATDVYSLGVLLHVLLTGHNPHGDTSRSADRARAVLEEELPDPSTTAQRDTHSETAAEIARRRGLAPNGLRRRLRGDLDDILQMALQRKPSDRYASAEDLRADLERYRDSRPVAARPDTPGYRFRRFVRRNTVPFVAGTTLLVSVLGFAIWMSVLYGRAVRAETESAIEAEKAKRVAAFLEELFEVSDPDVSPGETVTARELLDVGAERIATELGDEPDVRSSLQLTMARTYRALGLLEEAEELGRAALQTRATLFGDESEDVASALIELAETHIEQRRLEEGEDAARRGLAIRERRLAPDHSELGHAFGTLGAIQFFQTRYDDAERNMRRALDIYERAAVRDDKTIAVAASDLAGVYLNQGRPKDAIPLFEEAIEAYRHAGDGEHPWVSYFYGNLGHALMSAGRHEEAEAAFLRGLEIRIRGYGEEHPDVGTLHASLGELYQRMGRFDDAERHVRRSVTILRNAVPADHLELAWAVEGLGMVLLRAEKLDEADSLLAEAKSIAEKSVDGDNVLYGVLLDHVADLREAQDRWEEAGELREQVVVIFEGAYGPDHAYVASRLQGVAKNHEHRNRFEDAATHYGRIVSILQKLETTDAAQLDAARASLARVSEHTSTD